MLVRSSAERGLEREVDNDTRAEKLSKRDVQLVCCCCCCCCCCYFTLNYTLWSLCNILLTVYNGGLL